MNRLQPTSIPQTHPPHMFRRRPDRAKKSRKKTAGYRLAINTEWNNRVHPKPKERLLLNQTREPRNQHRQNSSKKLTPNALFIQKGKLCGLVSRRNIISYLARVNLVQSARPPATTAMRKESRPPTESFYHPAIVPLKISLLSNGTLRYGNLHAGMVDQSLSGNQSHRFRNKKMTWSVFPTRKRILPPGQLALSLSK